jgi:hypothetical protein
MKDHPPITACKAMTASEKKKKKKKKKITSQCE